MATETEIQAAALLKQLCEARKLLRRIAYPGRGSDDSRMDIFQASEMIQAVFTLEDLEPLEPDADLSNPDAAHARMWHTEAVRLAKKHGEKTFYN